MVRSGSSSTIWASIPDTGLRTYPLGAYNDVVDRDMDQFHEEADESHDCEADGRSDCDFLELLPVGFRATFDQTYRILNELFSRTEVHFDLIHCWQTSFSGFFKSKAKVHGLTRTDRRSDLLHRSTMNSAAKMSPQPNRWRWALTRWNLSSVQRSADASKHSRFFAGSPRLERFWFPSKSINHELR